MLDAPVMVEVLCMTHAGVRVGVPSKLVLAVQAATPDLSTVCLWPGPKDSSASSRIFMFRTAKGPRPVRGSAAVVARLEAGAVCPITPFLRRFMTLPYVVGLAELGGSLTWLVDPQRIVPDETGTGPPEASFAA
jgi:hypothetical protein